MYFSIAHERYTTPTGWLSIDSYLSGWEKKAQDCSNEEKYQSLN